MERANVSIRLVLADDHPVVRAGIRRELEAAGMQVVGEAADGNQALALAEQHQPDALILDMEMPGLTGVEVTRRVRQNQPKLPVVILSAYAHDGYVFGALDAGATAYVLKDEALETIVWAVRAAVGGNSWLSPSVATKVMARFAHNRSKTDDLSEREIQVLQQLGRGATNAEIGQALGIAEGTVKNYITSIYDKLDIHTRAELVAWVWDKRLLDI